MSKTKLLVSLAIVLLLASCVSIIIAAPKANAGSATYNPVANDSLFPFATPTPTPTTPPEPTPTPTPKPEPTTWPTLDLRCTTGASASNPKVQVSGTLSYNKTGIPDAPIYIGYSADFGTTWENTTLVPTRSDGTYVAVWVPPNATGNYVLDAHWSGNDTLHWLDATLNLTLAFDESGNLFSVASNSTLSDLDYDAATQILSFSTNGTSATTGYLYASLPKTLLSDVSALQVKMDGQSIAFSTEEQDDVWVVSCLYTQSEHAFVLQIPFGQALISDSTPWTVIAAIAAIVILIVVIALVVVMRRKRRTAATVAAILKENRPTY
ncbi:MAG: hypothetical protein ACQCN6_05760 [Candidatus Bathyarchaeia archaeon]|jgi:hypothetical protein